MKMTLLKTVLTSWTVIAFLRAASTFVIDCVECYFDSEVFQFLTFSSKLRIGNRMKKSPQKWFGNVHSKAFQTSYRGTQPVAGFLCSILHYVYDKRVLLTFPLLLNFSMISSLLAVFNHPERSSTSTFLLNWKSLHRNKYFHWLPVNAVKLSCNLGRRVIF